MKQAARTAKACNESSILIASLVVTASPPIDCATVLMLLLSIGASFDARCVRIGSAARRRLLEDTLDIHAVFRPIDDHGQDVELHGAFNRHEIAIDRVIFVVGEVEDPVVDATEALLLHHRHVSLLQMQIDPGVSLAPGELLAPGVDFMVDAETAIAPQHDTARSEEHT